MTPAAPPSSARPRVGLFVTCLVDLFRPSVGFAAVKLLEDAGCTVEVPEAQTCCGQPAFNSGDRATTEDLVRGLIDAFEGYDYVVAPSGSCAGMLRVHVPDLFENDPALAARASEFAGRCHELVSFLVDVMGVKKVDVSLERNVTYHDSCAGLRELKIKRQPRRLLGSIDKLTLTEMSEPEVCCGFGGTFCVKYPQISTKMVEIKVQDIADTGADMLLAGDLGCLMNMAGKLARQDNLIEVRHVAEVLAGDTDAPPIGRPAGA